jgi:hypothetical protein
LKPRSVEYAIRSQKLRRALSNIGPADELAQEQWFHTPHRD